MKQILQETQREDLDKFTTLKREGEISFQIYCRAHRIVLELG